MDAEPAVYLGTGLRDYIPLADGDVLVVHEGPQGGFHVFGSVMTVNLYPGSSTSDDKVNPVTTFQLDCHGKTGIAERSRSLALQGSTESATWIGELVPITIAYEEVTMLDGQEAEFFVSVEDACGRAASASVTATLTVELLP